MTKHCPGWLDGFKFIFSLFWSLEGPVGVGWLFQGLSGWLADLSCPHKVFPLRLSHLLTLEGPSKYHSYYLNHLFKNPRPN